ncbi:hypothetical protein FPHOBKDP_00147 [Listeria phage LPJP1]|nr:hypothetical protein FPHOBKDP_00147 [Listeria phage LPJP1]
MANDASLTQLHPSVSSVINANQSNFLTSNGVVTLFAADTFAKGKDGAIDFVSTKDEFIFKYGTPDYSKYGQSAYNIVEWLENGGQAFVLRLLPDDATFSHAILNVQSKVVSQGKNVLTTAGELVKLDDVHLRPTTAFIKKNNRDKNMLMSELTKTRSDENTVDGYTNNFVLLVYPEGRGEAYNNLGFRMTLNGSFDSAVNSSRVYNFEVIQYDSESNMTVVEGPFYVSFDRTAISASGESMFIEDVINRYSKHVNCEFNEENFNRLTKSINPNVNPGHIDILTGKSKVLPSGKAETVYSEITRDNEDIHISLQKYNARGELVTQNGNAVLNIPDPTDTVEAALISLDNGLRENIYNLDSNKLAYMKEQFPKLKTDSSSEFKLAMNQIINVPGDDSQPKTGEVVTLINNNFDSSNPSSLYSKYLIAKEAYISEDSDENLSAVLSYVDRLSEVLKSQFIDYSTKMNASYTLTLHNSPNPQLPAQYALELNSLTDLLNKKDQINIFTVEHQGKLFDIQETITKYRLGTVSGSYLEGLSLILNNVENEIKYVYESLLPVAYNGYQNVPVEISDKFDSSKPESITSRYNRILDLQSDMQSGIIDNTATNRDEITSVANDITIDLLDVINEVTFTSSTTNIESACTTSVSHILDNIVSFHSAVLTMITPQGTYDFDAIISNARTQIETEISKVSTSNSKFFNTNLIDFSNPIKLLLGSDGSFTYDPDNLSERRASIKQWLIKAYSGSVDSDLLNKDKYPIDIILDAKYDSDVKAAIGSLAANIRRDFQFFADDAGGSFSSSPVDSLSWRQTSAFNISSLNVSIFSQDLTYYDEYTGKDIRFTAPYQLASKIPYNAVQYGLQYPLAGPRRGLISGHKAISWVPNEAEKEKLYIAKINYIEQDTRRTKFGSQSTTETGYGALSNINNVFTILKMERDAKELVSSYQFEFNDEETKDSLYTELNSYLSKYTSDRSCESVVATVSASDYDKQQRIIKVNISVKFNGIIERVQLSFDVAN